MTIAGWVETVRAHGEVAFDVLRDGTAIVQTVLVRKLLDEGTWELGTTGLPRSPPSRSPGR